MQNSKNPRTDALELSLTTWTIDDLNKSMSHARQLEQELNEVKHDIESYRGALGYSIAGTHDGKLTDGTTPQCGMCNSEYRKSIEAERDQLRKELAESVSWVKSSMESTAIASATIARLESERDTLRKMLDAFAECVGHGDEWLMADYRELPHVRARKTK